MEGKNPREGWAALILKHYRQRRAGVARIRHTWLPTVRICQPDQASQPACVAWGWKCGVASPPVSSLADAAKSEIAASHVSMVSHPAAAIDAILAAVAAIGD
jgi:hypothetical protein